jgi:integrase
MPKLKNRPPKYCKLKQYAVVYSAGKIHYLGLYGSDASKTAYARFVAENRVSPLLYLPKTEGSSTTIAELAAAFLDHTKPITNKQNYNHYRIVAADFLLKLYGDKIPADNFKPRCLKLVRDEIILSRRFCRTMVNDYTRRIVALFEWGVSEELVLETTHRALKTIKALPEGYPDTFENPAREHVPDEVIKRTLPFMLPTLRAMVIVQRLTGCRPGEIFNMKVGEIDKTTDPDLWLYRPPSHKTQKKTGRKKIIPLGLPEQKLIAPFLEGKTAGQAVFSPRAAKLERLAEQWANRTTEPTPSQIAQHDARIAKIKQSGKEFYHKDTYRLAIELAIKEGNKVLPDGEKIEDWIPYQIRHQAATAMELEAGLDEAQTLLDHSSPDTTRRYAHGRLEKLKELAKNRKNPFD